MNASTFFTMNERAIDSIEHIGFLDAYTFGGDYFQLISVLTSELDTEAGNDEPGATNDVTLNFFAGDTGENDETLEYRLSLDYVVNGIGVESRESLPVTVDTTFKEMMDWYVSNCSSFDIGEDQLTKATTFIKQVHDLKL